MQKAVRMGLAIFIVGSLAGVVYAADPFFVGEKWTYKHEGAIPMRPPDMGITGDRTREVVAIQGENEKKRWLILEKWGDNDEFGGKMCVTAERIFDRIESGEDRVTTVDPGYPFDYLNLKPSEEKKFECTFKFGEQFTFPIKIAVKRVADETVKVPAGEFENCIHIQSEESITFSPPDGQEMTITTKRDQWYSPKVNGLVKETSESKRPDGQADKGSSELKSYTKEKKEEKK